MVETWKHFTNSTINLLLNPSVLLLDTYFSTGDFNESRLNDAVESYACNTWCQTYILTKIIQKLFCCLFGTQSPHEQCLNF